MRKVETLFDAATMMDDAHTELEEVVNAMLLLDESLEDEGCQSEENFKEWAAVNFVHRLPLHLATFRIICRDLIRLTDEMKSNADLVYAANKAQREATA